MVRKRLHRQIYYFDIKVVLAVILFLNCARASYATNREIVRSFCESLSSWASEGKISHLHAMENLRSESPSFRIGTRLMTELAQKNGLSKTDTYDWDNYIPCMQKEIDRGIQVSFSNINNVPVDYIEYDYPGLQYVSCNVVFKGTINSTQKDLFILKNGKIVKIADYIEKIDTATGVRKVKIDYLDLAESAFADGDYAKCYSLYKQGGLKELRQTNVIHRKSEVFPYIESCIALGYWNDAMHGITDNDAITNRKTWVNGREWKLDSEDIRTWNREKDPLMNHLLEKTYLYYVDKVSYLKESPIIKHVAECRGIPVDRLMEKASAYFWNYRRYRISISTTYAAAELGHVEARNRLGKYLLTGKVSDPMAGVDFTIRPDTIKALQWMERAAEKGDVESAKTAAHFYLTGKGVEQDLRKAFSFYSMDAQGADYDMKYGLGLCYYYGYGVERDAEKALSLLKDAEDWHAEVPYLIGNLLFADNYDTEAVKYYKRALNRGNLNKSVRKSILMVLSECHRHGRCGLPVDPEESERLLREAENISEDGIGSADRYMMSLTQISLDHE